MASTITLYTSHAGSSGSSAAIVLSGSGGKQFTGSGTPWTSQTTSPYRIAMNDVTGPRWTPAAADHGVQFGGGAPFAWGGGAPLYSMPGDVTEEIPIQCYGSDFDNAMFLVRQLQYVLSSPANATWPLILAVQPDGSTNVSYFEIKAGVVQENPRFINDEAGRGCVRAVITWVRSPHAGAASLATLINNAVFTNVGTGANNNCQTLGISTFSASTTDGDRTLAGQPMNLKIANGTSSAGGRFWLASVLERVYTSVSTSKSTTSSQTWGLSAANVTLNSALYYRTTVKGRVLARFTTFTQLAKQKFQCAVYDAGGTLTGSRLMVSKQIPPDNTGASSILIDFGWFDLSFLRRNQLGTTAPKITVDFTLYSTDGTNVTATLDYFEVLQYWDFCRIDAGNLTVSSSNSMYCEAVNNLNQNAYTPSRPPVAYMTTTSNDQPLDPRVIRGRLPRARQGALLYVAWLDSSSVHDKTNTVRVTAQHMPQFSTMRGDG